MWNEFPLYVLFNMKYHRRTSVFRKNINFRLLRRMKIVRYVKIPRTNRNPDVVSFQCVIFVHSTFEFDALAILTIIDLPLPNAAYMRQWIGLALLQIMVCGLFDAKPLSKPMLGYLNWTRRKKLHWMCNQNASKNTVCEMAVIFSMGRRVKD